jgi:hypothetical protein
MRTRLREVLQAAHSHRAAGVLTTAREWARLLRRPVRFLARLAYLEGVYLVEARLAKQARKDGGR